MLTNLSGTTVTHFQIEHLLGEGGMGSVYRAMDLDLQRPVALKFMHPHLARQPQFQKRFLREARAAAALDHPGIVRVLAYEHVEDSLILVMELVSGGSLRDFMNGQRERSKLVPYAVAADLARQIAEALHYAHQQGMYHRDIKPDNILLKPDPGQISGFRTLISDFGLARMAEMDGMSTTGMPMGTLAYMSPEQAEGEKVDSRTDIYSLGITLYELTAGRPPFQPRSITEAIRLHTREPLPALNASRPSFPVELEQIIGKSTAKDPKDRYQLGSELAYALAHFIASSPAPATLEAPTIMLPPAEPGPPQPVPLPEPAPIPVVVPAPVSPADEGLTADLTPLWQRGRQGAFTLHLVNRGKAPLTCRIAARDAAGMLDCSVPTPAVTLQPGQRMEVPLQVTARRRRWLGNEVSRTFDVDLVTTPLVPADHPLTATLAVPTAISIWLLFAVLAAAVFPVLLRSLRVVGMEGWHGWEFAPLVVIGGYALLRLVLELRQPPPAGSFTPALAYSAPVMSPSPLPVTPITRETPVAPVQASQPGFDFPESPVASPPIADSRPPADTRPTAEPGTGQFAQQIRDQILLQARGSTDLRMDPGAVATVVLELCNATSVVEHFTLEVSGLPNAWYTVPRDPLRLMPNGRDTAQILFHPPLDRRTQSGVYPYEIRAVARTQGLTSVAEQGSLRVSASPFAVQPAVGTLDAAAAGPVLRQDREQVILTLRDSNTVAVEPGQRATLVVEIRNQSDQPDYFSLELDGLAREWYTLPPQSLRLMPGSRDTAQVLFHPPSNVRAQVGICPFALRAVAREQGLRSVAEQAVLQILPATPVAQSAFPEPVVAPPVPTPAPMPARDPVVISIKDSNRITVDPGGRATLILEVSNFSGQTDDFMVEVTGLAREWYTAPRDAMRLPANGHDTAHLIIHPPLGKQSLAGAHPFEVRATARRQGVRSAAEQAVLQVAPQRLFVAELRASPLRGRQRRFAVSVENKGNVAAAYRVEARDREGRLNLRVEPRQVVLNPNQKRTICVIAAARRPGLFGRPSGHPFDIAVQPEDPGQAAQLMAAELVTPSLLPWWMLGLLLLAVAVFAAENVFYLDLPLMHAGSWLVLGAVWLVLVVARLFHGLHLPLWLIALYALATAGVLGQFGVLYPYYCSDRLNAYACDYWLDEMMGGIYDPAGLGLIPLALVALYEARRFLGGLWRLLRGR